MYGDIAEGEIFSEGLKKNYFYSHIFLRGSTKRSDQIDGAIYDIVGGKQEVLAVFQLNHAMKNGQAMLTFSTLQQGGRFLPELAVLHRDEKGMPEGDVNFDLFKKNMNTTNEK